MDCARLVSQSINSLHLHVYQYMGPMKSYLFSPKFFSVRSSLILFDALISNQLVEFLKL